MLGVGFKKLISLMSEYVDCNSSSYVLLLYENFYLGSCDFYFS